MCTVSTEEKVLMYPVLSCILINRFWYPLKSEVTTVDILKLSFQVRNGTQLGIKLIDNTN